jgi:predicted Zn-dependent protease
MFPVQVAGVALLVYLLTLSHGATIHSLPLTAKVAGWDIIPISGQSLLWLLTLPLKLLPAGWVSLLLNLLAALTGAATLGILARTMELLDWDRPLATLAGWRARLPVICACAVCGLEFNFWQQATAMTGEMLQLLVFAAAIWCLFEYRRSSHFRWLQAAALVWGLGMAENWMMLLGLPVFVALVFWFGKFRILSVKAILRLAVFGLLGFSVFAVMPLVNGISPGSPWSFGEAWLKTLAGFKGVITLAYYNFWRGHRLAFIAVGIFYLVPIVMLLVRLRDEGTQHKVGVDQFQTWIYRALQSAVLLACLWLAFNPVVGPQQIVLKQTGLGLSFLSLGYLLAVCAGFLTGNLMLAFPPPAPERDYRRLGRMSALLPRITVPAFAALFAIVCAGLIFRNAPAVTRPNRLPLEQFGRLALQGLPATQFVLLSDDPQRLFAFQAAAANSGREFLALDTRLLAAPAYRRWIAARHPDAGLAGSPTNTLTTDESLLLLSQLSRSNRVFYLHPSFGHFFELYYPEPAGLVTGLKQFQDKSVNPPPLDTNTISKIESFWNDHLSQLEAISQSLPEAKPDRRSLTGKVYQRFHLQPAPMLQTQLLGEWYAMALDDWAVRLQRAGQLEAAKIRFALAAALNPNNGAAKVNSECNSNLIAGITLNLAGAESIASQLGRLPQMSRFLFVNGPVDEPSFCYVLGGTFLKAGLPRQALQQLERAHELAPTVILPKLALAELYTRLGSAQKARELISQVRKDASSLPQKNQLETSLSLLEASSWLAQTNAVNAREVLQNLLTSNPGDPRTQHLVAQAYYSFGDYSNALEVINRQLTATPNDIACQISLATVLLRVGDATQAVETLNHVLTLTNSPDIRLLRNVARIEAGHLDAAEGDYLEMQTQDLNQTLITYGLAEIALRRHNTNRAVELLQSCMANFPAGSPQLQMLTNRISALKQP